MENTNFKELNKQYQDLLLEAEKAVKTAYDPYSKLFVGAALLTKDNKVITGSNVKGAVSGICAERVAIFKANSMGERHFKAIAIISSFENERPITPCGICRQMLFEFSQVSSIDLDVIMSNTNKDKIIIAKLSELLPLAFDLNIEINNF